MLAKVIGLDLKKKERKNHQSEQQHRNNLWEKSLEMAELQLPDLIKTEHYQHHIEEPHFIPP